ncbi:MAG: Mur ligase family protein [Moraxella sp.]|nr:Mur ligase family protein [Moraxella sp.]
MTLYVWTDELLAKATDGRWQGLTQTLSSTTITTDTRTIKAGDVFLALTGENFDGHDFILTAQQKGAVAVIAQRQTDSSLPHLLVDDGRVALAKLGQYRRNAHPDLTMIALTGSSGKTTTKEMLGAIFGQIAPTLITRGNLNNDLGVPMMLLELTDEHRFAIMELGANHVGEIAYTTELVRPNVACVLNIGTAHLGEFGGRDNIAKTKAEIFAGLLGNGVAVLPFGDEYYEVLRQQAEQYTTHMLSFGERAVPLSQAGIDFESMSELERAEFADIDSVLMMGDVFADDVECGVQSSEFMLNVNLQVDEIDSEMIHMAFVGEHNISNALTAVATAVGVPLPLIKSGLERAVPPKGRLTRTPFGKHVLIDDTYNANPTSVLAAAKVLVGEETQKILVLGDIAELGATAADEHDRLGQALAVLDIDIVLTVGELMAYCSQAMNKIKPKLSTHFDSKAELLNALQQLLTAGQSVVLFKGSRTARMESIIHELVQSMDSSTASNNTGD